MSFGHRLDEETSAQIRNLAGNQRITTVTFYDADHPFEVGQQFVEALMEVSEGRDVTINMLNKSEERADLLRLFASIIAEHGETVKFFVDLTPPPEIWHMTIKIENVYPDGTVEFEKDIEVPRPPEDPDERAESSDDGDWAYDHLYPHTGTGRTKGDAGYFVTIIKCEEDESLVGEEFEWGT